MIRVATKRHKDVRGHKEHKGHKGAIPDVGTWFSGDHLSASILLKATTRTDPVLEAKVICRAITQRPTLVTFLLVIFVLFVADLRALRG